MWLRLRSFRVRCLFLFPLIDDGRVAPHHSPLTQRLLYCDFKRPGTPNQRQLGGRWERVGHVRTGQCMTLGKLHRFPHSRTSHRADFAHVCTSNGFKSGLCRRRIRLQLVGGERAHAARRPQGSQASLVRGSTRKRDTYRLSTCRRAGGCLTPFSVEIRFSAAAGGAAQSRTLSALLVAPVPPPDRREQPRSAPKGSWGWRASRTRQAIRLGMAAASHAVYGAIAVDADMASGPEWMQGLLSCLVSRVAGGTQACHCTPSTLSFKSSSRFVRCVRT